MRSLGQKKIGTETIKRCLMFKIGDSNVMGPLCIL